MIKLSNGHCLEFLAASGSLGFDGRGYFWEYPLRWLKILDTSLLTIVTKTIFLEPRKGNFRKHTPLDVIKFISVDGEVINPFLALLHRSCVAGILNALNLTGPGFEVWLKRHYSVIRRFNNKVMVSIAGEEEDCLIMVKRLQGLKNIVGVEYDSSCPSNIEDTERVIRVCSAIKENSDLPLFLKLGYGQPYVTITKAVEGKVEAISINSVPWRFIFSDRESPLTKYGGGGLSGPLAQAFTRRMMDEIIDETEIPVIAPSFWDYDTFVNLQRHHRAQAFHFGSIFMFYPCRPTRYIRRWLKEKDKAAEH